MLEIIALNCAHKKNNFLHDDEIKEEDFYDKLETLFRQDHFWHENIAKRDDKSFPTHSELRYLRTTPLNG